MLMFFNRKEPSIAVMEPEIECKNGKIFSIPSRKVNLKNVLVDLSQIFIVQVLATLHG